MVSGSFPLPHMAYAHYSVLQGESGRGKATLGRSVCRALPLQATVWLSHLQALSPHSFGPRPSPTLRAAVD